MSKRAVVAFAVAALGATLGQAQPPASVPLTASASVRGLEQPVEVRRDRWGINHIEAKTERDLFFAQGYAAARDRLFQFELWRRQATGTLAEVLGPREVARDRWDGFLPIAELPHRIDPAEGVHRHGERVSLSPRIPAPRCAALHVGRRLPGPANRGGPDEGGPPHRGRQRAPPTRRAVDSRPPPRAAAAAARDALVAWDGVMARRSVAAGVHSMLLRQLIGLMRDRFVPDAVEDDLTLSVTRMLEWLEQPERRFGAEAAAERDRVLVRALEESVAELTRKLGADMEGWQWGQPRYHHVQLRHMLSTLLPPDLAATLDVGPLPRGGDAHTPNVTSSRDNQTNGASFRLIADTGDWNRSVGTNTPGQSGDPESPHYRDLFELWANDRYFPVAFSADMVESVTRERTVLLPVATAR